MIIKLFEEYLKESDSSINAREDISMRAPGYELSVNTQLDVYREDYPNIVVDFPDLFMYIDLQNINIEDYDKLSSSTKAKIQKIILDLDTSLDHELKNFIKNMQAKLLKTTEEIYKIPEVTGKKYGL